MGKNTCICYFCLGIMKQSGVIFYLFFCIILVLMQVTQNSDDESKKAENTSVLTNVSEKTFPVILMPVQVDYLPSDDDNSESEASVNAENEQENAGFKLTKDWTKISEAFKRLIYNAMGIEEKARPAREFDVKNRLAKALKKRESVYANNISKVDIKKGKEKSSNVPGTNFTVDELKRVLAHLNVEDNSTEMRPRNVTSGFRSIEELKKEFLQINFSMKTQTEVLIDLLKKYANYDDEVKISVLEDLEFLVHQYDVAQDFVKVGGIYLLLSDVNTSNSQLRSLIPFTLGSAMQGNPKVQIAVLENNGLPEFIRLLKFDSSAEVKARSLYALSSLIRNFPLAQETFVQNDGFKTLANIFDPLLNSSIRLQMKAVNLIYDLISEQQLAEVYATADDEIQQEKLRQYKRFDIQKQIQENGFCSILPKLLSVPNYDSQEKVIKAMQLLVNECRDPFLTTISTLQKLADEYKSSLKEELHELLEYDVNVNDANVEETYFYSLYHSVTELISSLEFTPRDEL